MEYLHNIYHYNDYFVMDLIKCINKFIISSPLLVSLTLSNSSK